MTFNQSPRIAIQEGQTVVWRCPNCTEANAPGTRYCTRCRNTLAYECANCSNVVVLTAEFCPQCGLSPQEAASQRERDSQTVLMRSAQSIDGDLQLKEMTRLLAKANRQSEALHLLWLLLGLPGLIVTAVIYWNAIGTANEVLDYPPVLRDARLRTRAQATANRARRLRNLSLILMALLLALTVAYFVCAVGSVFTSAILGGMN
ncbi:MAG: zinc ribbon domain-containing protein [Anaerolineae bacterium]|nr:zinc ribbon domain-containing protein [Anaerolineae bacterium]